MRKRAVFFLLMLTASFIISASPSSFVPLYSGFYEDFDFLAASLGIMTNHTRPFTYREAGMYLDQMSSFQMNGTQEKVYAGLIDFVAVCDTEDVAEFEYNIIVNPEVYIQSDTDFRDRVDFLNASDGLEGIKYSYENSDKFLLYYRSRPHFADIDMTLTFSDTISLFFQLPVTNTVHTGVPSGSQRLMSNIIFLAAPLNLSVDSLQDFSMNFPYRAYFSAAGSWYSIQVGRERFDFGSSPTGSFVISSDLPYHNALSLSLFTENFKYNFFASFFPHPSQYIMNPGTTASMYETDLVFDQNEDAFTGIKMFMSHRFEWISDKRNHHIAVTEGIMYQSDYGILDLQVFNPMMFFHNMYIAGNSNSILQLDWNFAFAKGVTQHLSFAIDDLSIPFEETDGSDTRPNAIGLQYGIATSHVFMDGFFEANLEFTMMSPYFYLRDGRKDSSYPVDFVVAIRNQRSSFGIYDLYTIGYEGGGDQSIVYLDFSYRVPSSYQIKAFFEYRKYGENNLMTVYAKGNNGDNYAHSFKYGVSGEYSFTPGMTIGAGLTGWNILNFDNDPGKVKNNFTAEVSVKYTTNPFRVVR